MSDYPAEKFAGYFLEWQLIEDEKDALAKRSKDLFKAMKDGGYDTKNARICFREKRAALEASPEDIVKAEENEAILDLYRDALTNGLASRAGRAREGKDRAGSSSGRTPDFGSGNVGSNPAPVATPETGEITEQPETANEKPLSGRSAAQADDSKSGGDRNPVDEALVTAGETALLSPSPVAAQVQQAKAGEAPTGASSAPHSEDDDFNPSKPTFLKSEQRKSIADYRPNCRNPDACGASGLTECYSCRKAAETASETEAA